MFILGQHKPGDVPVVSAQYLKLFTGSYQALSIVGYMIGSKEFPSLPAFYNLSLAYRSGDFNDDDSMMLLCVSAM